MHRHIIFLPALFFALAHAAPTPSANTLTAREPTPFPQTDDNSIPGLYEIAEATTDQPNQPPTEEPIPSPNEELLAYASGDTSPNPNPSSPPPTTEPPSNPNPPPPPPLSPQSPPTQSPPCRPGSYNCLSKTPNTPQILLNAHGIYAPEDGTGQQQQHAIAFTDRHGLVQSQSPAEKICDGAQYMRASSALQQSHCRLCLKSDNDYCVLWRGGGGVV